MSSKLSAFMLVALVVLAAAASSADAIQCAQAITILLPCESYLVGQAPALTAPCCQGASTLNSMARTKADIKALCLCLKKAAADLHVVVPRAKSLPDMCHIKTPVPIDPNVDCDKI